MIPELQILLADSLVDAELWPMLGPTFMGDAMLSSHLVELVTQRKHHARIGILSG